MEGKANFFERRVSSYRKSYISIEIEPSGWSNNLFELHD